MDVGDYDMRTPLHIASVSNHLDVVRYLIEDCRVNPSPVDRWGVTPLSDAKILGNNEIVKYLESKGAKFGKNVPYTAVKPDSTVLDTFRMIYAGYYEDVNIIDVLRKLKVDINGQDYDGRSALHLAASEGKLDAVMYLV